MARTNGCGALPASTSLKGSPDAETEVVRLEWTGCNSGQSVRLYRVEGGGHQLFGRQGTLPVVLGPSTRQVSAPDIIMELIAQAHGGGAHRNSSSTSGGASRESP